MSDDLHWMPAWRLRQLVATGQLSPVEVVEHFLGRAEELDTPASLLPGARPGRSQGAGQQAEQAVRLHDDLGPLHGIPVSIKAHIAGRGAACLRHVRRTQAARPGHPRCSGGATATRGGGASSSAPTSSRGWVCRICVTASASPPPTWPITAATRGTSPECPARPAQGLAAAVAAGVIPIAIGSDGGGSTRLPAAWCGIVGLHPTLGRVPSGGRGASGWNTTLGPLARDPAEWPWCCRRSPDLTVARSCRCRTTRLTMSALEEGVEGWRLAWTDDFGFARTYAGPESERWSTWSAPALAASPSWARRCRPRRSRGRTGGPTRPS